MGNEVHLKSISDAAAEVIRKCVKAMYSGSKTLEQIVNIMIEDVRGNAAGVELLFKEYQLLDKKVSVNEGMLHCCKYYE